MVKTTAEMDRKLSELLADAQAAVDELRRQQRETGEFARKDHVEASGKVGMVGGFLAAVVAGGFTEYPPELGERFAQIAADARDLLYRDRRPRFDPNADPNRGAD